MSDALGHELFYDRDRPRTRKMPRTSAVSIGRRDVGPNQPVFVIGEIGINHNGSLELAKELIEGASRAGCDAVKFQKRTPEVCVPRDQWYQMRDTPWGEMTYIDYRMRMEFGEAEYREIDRLCRSLGILWFASCWDEPAVDFIERFDPPGYKAASASLTDLPLIVAMKRTGKPLILSTGMSTLEEIDLAVQAVGTEDLAIAHSTSTYPCPVDELNLRMITALVRRFPDCPIGYSGHEMGLATTCAAVTLGATFIERHITVDRTLWGSDHAASVELRELGELVQSIRDIETAFGDGIKRVYPSELPFRRKLRRVRSHLDGS